VGKLVNEKFSEYKIKAESKSPNGHHFILTKDGVKTHLKVVNSSALDDEGIDEVELLKVITSENVIRLLEYGEIGDDFTYLIFPHINGKTLDKLKDESGWNTADLQKLASDMSTAVKDMSDAGVIHRDIKPKNIIREERTGKYILLDLGIGYFVDQADRDNTKAKGSRNYSSPEQFKSIESDSDDISFSSDHFSIGVILYELASNAHPFGEFNEEKYSTIGEAICKMTAQPITAKRTNLDTDLTSVIMRLLQKSPARRYWSPTALQMALRGEVSNDIQKLDFYITEPKSGDFIDKYLAGVEDADKPDGAVLPINASEARIKRIVDRGLEVMLDPETFRLPFPKAAQSNLRKSLKLPSGKLTTTKINDDKFLKKLIEKVVALQTKCNTIMLPYFAITTLDDGLIEINRKIERIYFKQVRDTQETRQVFAGLMIPHSLIVDANSRIKLMSRLMAPTKVDGAYIVFENGDDTPFTLEEHDYLDGVSEITAMLKARGRVMIGRADLAFMPILKDGIIVTSPDKSHRRFSFKAKLTNPKDQNGGQGEEAIKLRYYCEPLFNFIEEKSTLETLARLGFEDRLKCDCAYCEASKPFDASTDKSHEDARKHFYYRIAKLRNAFTGMRENDSRIKFLEILNGASSLADEISSKSAGSERFSKHERLIEII